MYGAPAFIASEKDISALLGHAQTKANWQTMSAWLDDQNFICIMEASTHKHGNNKDQEMGCMVERQDLNARSVLAKQPGNGNSAVPHPLCAWPVNVEGVPRRMKLAVSCAWLPCIPKPVRLWLCQCASAAKLT